MDAFLNTAQLAGTDFTAGGFVFDFLVHLVNIFRKEKRKIKVLPQTTTLQNPYLLSEVEEKKVVLRHLANKQRLRVPRRPTWTKLVSPSELDRNEKTAFLDWRRGLAEWVF